MCLYPTLIKNRKYTANKKNGGKVPPVTDERVKWVPIGCQDCMECRKQKARAWQVRLLEDIKTNKDGKFITLTFSNESIQKWVSEIQKDYKEPPTGYELDNEIATRAVRNFLENWRKKYGRSLRHWFVTELGHNGTENIHLHGIIWTKETMETVAAKWKNGWVWKGKLNHSTGQLINYVNGRTVNYIVKYVNKLDRKHRYYKSKILTSPGIGANYTATHNNKLNRYNGTNTRENYITDTGHKIAMPTYWRNKTYTEEEREKLWLHRLDKNERWVNGIRITRQDTIKGQQEYWKIVESERRKNKELGFGDGQTNWSRRRYEEQRREMMMGQRLKGKSKNQKNQQKSVTFSNEQMEIEIDFTQWGGSMILYKEENRAGGKPPAPP